MRDSKRRKHRNIDAYNTEFFSPPPFVPAERTCLITQKLTFQTYGKHPANPARRSVFHPAEASIFTNLKEQTQIYGKICPNFGNFTNNTAERPNVPDFGHFQAADETARIKQSHEFAPPVDPDNHIGFSSSPNARLPDIFKNIEFPSNLFSCCDVCTQPLEGPPNCKIRQISATLSQDIRPTFL